MYDICISIDFRIPRISYHLTRLFNSIIKRDGAHKRRLWETIALFKVNEKSQYDIILCKRQLVQDVRTIDTFKIS